MKNQKAFSLLEAMVVLAIAGILISLAIPAIRGAVSGAQRAQVLSNAKQLYTVVATYSADGETIWPSTNSFGDWVTRMSGHISTNDLKAIFSGGGVKVIAFPPERSSLNIYQVKDFSKDDYIFASSANWNASAPAIPGEDAAPFGQSGFIYITKGGRALNAPITDALTAAIAGQPAPMSGIPPP